MLCCFFLLILVILFSNTLPLDLQPIDFRIFRMKWSDFNLVSWRCFVSVCLSASPPSTNKATAQTLHVCYRSPSFLYVCVCASERAGVCVLFFRVGVFAAPLRRDTDACFPGQGWMYHSAVLSDLLWAAFKCTAMTFLLFFGHCERACQRLDDLCAFVKGSSQV